MGLLFVCYDLLIRLYDDGTAASMHLILDTKSNFLFIFLKSFAIQHWMFANS